MDTRALDFLKSASSSVKGVSDRNLQNIAELKTVYSQYLSAVADSVQARLEYFEVIEKYENSSQPQNTLAAPSFLSVKPAETLNTQGMIEDSEKVEELATLVASVNEQVEFLEQRIHYLTKAILNDTATTLEQASQIDSYLETQLSKLDSIYGTVSMPGVTVSQ